MPRRALGVFVGVLLMLSVFATPAPAAPDTTTTTVAPGSQADLEQKLRTTQAAANAAAARFQQATAKHESLLDEISAVEERIGTERQRANELRSIAQRRAVAAYKSRQVGADVTSAIFSGDDLLTGIRRTALLQHANAKDDAAIDELRALDEDLGIQKNELEQKREAAAKVLSQAQAEKATLESTVAEAQRAYDELVARLAREAASRAAAERAAQQAAASVRPPTVVTGTPVAGFLCPVRGSFGNDYGDARSGGRSHGGIDIFAGSGTPVVAVKSGTLAFESGGAGGNAAYVHAGDGNSYFYAHFSSYAGGPRSVSQGEVIGYVGMTGSATTPHLHFEIRTPSGTINPYPTLVSAC